MKNEDRDKTTSNAELATLRQRESFGLHQVVALIEIRYARGAVAYS